MSAQIEYVANPNPEEQSYDLAGRPNSTLIGFYKVRFEDGWTIAMPHLGVVGTVSAAPVHDDPDARAFLLDRAEEAHRECEARA